jgi:CDP-diacylglycerol--glycerol-3-phosphate 3-phosphatidyltransferase
MTTGMKEAPRATAMNLPNKITVARLAISLMVFVLIPQRYFVTSLIFFLLAAGTDWIDGYLARKYKLITQFGRILDPFADKILICGVFIFLAAEPASQIASWMAVVVVGRELLVTALRSFLEQHGADFSANLAGKLKMGFQCLAAASSLVLLSYQGAPPSWLPGFVFTAAWLAVGSTIYSGYGYVMSAATMLRGMRA